MRTRSSTSRRTAVLVGALVTLAGAGPATAATVSASPTAITYAAAAAEANQPVITYIATATPRYRVTDAGAPLAAGAGCVVVPGGLECDDLGVTSISVTLADLDDRGGSIAADIVATLNLNAGDGADTFSNGSGGGNLAGGAGADELAGGVGNETLNGEAGGDVLRGGAGNDNLVGGADNDQLFGGTGNDDLNGGTGDDAQFGENGQDRFGNQGDDPGADTYTGGAESDTVFFTAAIRPVNVSLDDARNDGPFGQDDVRGDVENVRGSDGNDTLAGNGAANSLQGGPGSDVINGLGGDDLLIGTDLVASTGANDVLNGGDGNDILVDGGGDDPDAFTQSMLSVTLDDVADDGLVGEGDNVHSDVENIAAGLFNAVLRGSAAVNVMSGSGANDTIDVRGPGPDVVACGGGQDSVVGDPDDRIDPEGGGFCESADLGAGPAPPGAPALDADFVSRRVSKGVPRVRIGCGPGSQGPCVGTFSITVAGKRVVSGEFALTAGESETLQLRLPKALRRKLSRGGRVRAVLRVRATDNTGLNTLVRRTVSLRRK